MTSKIINCLAFLLNPNLKLSNDILFDPNLVEIISDHLHHQIFEDCVNLLFILQTLIYISIISKNEIRLRELLREFEVFDIIEEIQNDEICEEINDKSIENILYFIMGNN